MVKGKTGPEASIGGRIRQARFQLAARLGQTVTQTWLANQAGVSGPTVSQWEAGVTEPTLTSVRRIATALQVSPGWIAWGEVTYVPPEGVTLTPESDPDEKPAKGAAPRSRKGRKVSGDR